MKQIPFGIILTGGGSKLNNVNDLAQEIFEMPIKKPIVPAEKELQDNAPSRSAKLRYLVKKENIYEIETDIIDQFHELLEIENLSLKL